MYIDISFTIISFFTLILTAFGLSLGWVSKIFYKIKNASQLFVSDIFHKKRQFQYAFVNVIAIGVFEK
jgi:hypothetical protein